MNSQDLDMIRDSAQAAMRDISPVTALRAIRDGAHDPGFDPAVWRTCGELGWSGVLVDEPSGGTDMGFAAAAIIARETGRTLCLSPFLSTALMAAVALRQSGNAAVNGRWLSRIAAADAILSPAIDEDRWHDPGRCTATAVNTGDTFRLAGTKVAVADGHVADGFIVTASIMGQDGSPVSGLFFVEARTAGLSVTPQRLIDGRLVSTVVFDAAPVPAAYCLASGAAATDVIQHMLRAGYTGLAARQCGLAEEALRRTLDYMRQRRQFGQPIGTFQALQHRAALLHCEIENAWSATLAAAQALDAGAADAALRASVAKAKSAETSCMVAAECLQFHGGIGMTDEHEIGFFLKQARVEAELLGGYSFHADAVATALGY